MKKSRRLQNIVEYKAMQEKNAREELGRCHQKHQEIITQLESLTQYRQDYHNKYKKLGVGGVAMKQLLDFRLFIEKMDKAITDQKSLLKQMENDLVNKRKVWKKAYQSAKSLQKVQAISMRDETRREQRREQAEQDERTSRPSGIKNA